MTNAEKIKASGIRHSGFVIDSSFVIRHSSLRAAGAFTLIELVVVVGLILVLTGLVLSTVGYARKKGARARAETEIAAMVAAIENYKSDIGVYPRGQSTSTPPTGTPVYTVATSGTDDLDAHNNTDSTLKIYQDACRYLYEQLSGDVNLDLVPDAGKKTYFTFKESMLATIKDANGRTVGLSHIKDPFGNSYGYSTAQAANPGGAAGYNPTFDLWSTAGVAPSPTPAPPATLQDLWIKNW